MQYTCPGIIKVSQYSSMTEKLHWVSHSAVLLCLNSYAYIGCVRISHSHHQAMRDAAMTVCCFLFASISESSWGRTPARNSFCPYDLLQKTRAFRRRHLRSIRELCL